MYSIALVTLALALALFSFVAAAQEEVDTLPTLKIHASPVSVSGVGDLSGPKILAGKKSTALKKAETPATPQNSYRQTLAQFSGLLITEVNNESYASMSYRGLGNPHESYNILLLRDGLPLAADPYGYPASYFVPPLDSVDRIDFIRGGSGLLFGPQPGGVVNFDLRQAPPRAQDTKVTSKHTYGSWSTYSTYNEVTGSDDKFGYLASVHYRQSQGFRQTNAGYGILNPRMNLAYRPTNSGRLFFDIDYYTSKHQEPGGLAKERGGGLLSFDESREHNTLRFDKLHVDRIQYTFGYDRAWTDRSLSEFRAWGGRYDRRSFRQKAGAAPAFGGIPLGTTNNIEAQVFYSRGYEVRNLLQWNFLNQPQNLTVGLSYLKIESPYTQDEGPSADAMGGPRKKQMDRSTQTLSVFAENQFRYGRFSLAPGVRFENIEQNIVENMNVGSAVPLRDNEHSEDVMLFGVGAQYQLAETWQVYGNYSQGYKPPTFSETVPRSTGSTVSENINSARTLSRELGVRRESTNGYFDASLFLITYSDQFGQVGTNFQNVGSGEHRGADVAAGHRLYGGLSGYVNAAWLNATFTNSASDGFTPAYAPGYIFRLGLNYKEGERWQVTLQAQLLDQHYGNDNNTAQFEVPGYSVWDLSGKVRLGRILDEVTGSLHWGIQNLADKKYYARVRSNGVEPAPPRTYFAGLELNF